MMKSKMTNLVLASLLSISFGSAFAASDTSSTDTLNPKTGGAQQTPSKSGADQSGHSNGTHSDTGSQGAGAGAGKSVDGGTTGSSAGKTGGPTQTGPNGTGPGASGGDGH